MTPKELAETISRKIELMPERSILNSGAADIIIMGLLQNMLGVMVTLAHQNEEILKELKNSPLAIPLIKEPTNS